MRSTLTIFLAAGWLLWTDPPLDAMKEHYPPERLQAEAQLIVQGKVSSYTATDKALGGGGKTKMVHLQVLVESVSKGEEFAKPGETVEVRCWRGIKRPWNADMFDDYSGNHLIPGPGAVATFYLQQDAEKNWHALWPNGISAPPGSPALKFASEPQDRPPWELPMILVMSVGTAALLVGGPVWWRRRSRHPVE